MKRILITGAEGFFASRFIDYYKDKYEIISVSHSQLDITKEEQTIALLKELKPDYLVHAAAISDTGLCERNLELSYKVNVEGTINLAKGCSSAGAKMIYLSSDQIYNGNIEEGPYKEDCVAIPNTVYGKHKLEAEKQLGRILDNAVILRLTWLFSLPERNKKINSNLVWNIAKAAMKNESIMFPVNEYRGITYIYDLLENFDSILDLPEGIYNSGGESNLSTYEAAEIVFRNMGLSNRSGELLIKNTESYKDKPRDLRICNEKLKAHNIYFTNTEEAIIKCIRGFYSDSLY